jgi:hypothetical protein
MGMDNLLGVVCLGAFGWLYATFIIFAGLVGVAGTALWIWMLVEVLSRETDEGNNRLVWALVIVFTHWVGALIYLFVRRSERVRKLGK